MEVRTKRALMLDMVMITTNEDGEGSCQRRSYRYRDQKEYAHKDATPMQINYRESNSIRRSALNLGSG